MTAATPFRWIESSSWELPFFGLPSRIPWPADVPTEAAEKAPFEVEHMLAAIDEMGSSAEDPWKSFAAASEVLGELAEALEGSEVVEAKELLAEFDRLHPGTPFALYHQGMVARMEGLEDEALRLFREAAAKTPKVAPIWNNIGELLSLRDDREAAIEAFKHSLAAAPRNAPALEGLARLRLLVKAQKDPANPEDFVYLDLPTFGKMTADALNQAANKPDELLARGEQLMRDNLLPDLGIKALEHALQLRPDHPRTLFALAAAYRVSGKLQQAREIAQRYCALHPGDTNGHFHLAQICHASGHPAGERDALERVLEIDPNVQPALGLFFELSPTEHDPAKEEALTNFAAERKSWMAYLLASDLARRRADTRGAVKWAEHAYRLAPEMEDVLLNYATAIGEARDFARLASVIKPVLEREDASPRAACVYAQVLHQVGLVKESITFLKKFLNRPNLPEEAAAQAHLLLEAWHGLVTGAGAQLEVHPSGHLVRPVVVALEDGDGGVVLKAGASLPAEGTFPWRARGPEAMVALQQGHRGAGVPERSLGTFVARHIRLDPDGSAAIECHVTGLPNGVIHFRASQGERKLAVRWQPDAGEKSLSRPGSRG